MSMENGIDALSLSYNETLKSFRVGKAHNLVNMMLTNIAAIDFDEIAVTYNTLTDVFVLKKSSVAAATLTVTYTDATKAVASGIVKS